MKKLSLLLIFLSALAVNAQVVITATTKGFTVNGALYPKNSIALDMPAGTTNVGVLALPNKVIANLQAVSNYKRSGGVPFANRAALVAFFDSFMTYAGIVADSDIFATTYDVDTAKEAIRGEMATIPTITTDVFTVRSNAVQFLNSDETAGNQIRPNATDIVTDRMPVNSGTFVLNTDNGASMSVDGLTPGPITIFSTYANRGDFVITSIDMVPTAIIGTGTAPTITIGDNGSDFNNVVHSVTLSLTSRVVYSPTVFINVITKDTAIKINITSEATGYDEYAFSVRVNGYYLE